MNLWPVEHFFQHICHHFWVGLLLHPANPPKRMTNMLKKVFKWSEVHLSEMTCYKIHTLMGGWDGVCEPCIYSCELFSSNIECLNDFNVWCILWLNPYVNNDWSCLDLCGMDFLEICINRSSQCVARFYEAWHGNWPENMREREMMTLLLSNHSSYARGAWVP